MPAERLAMRKIREILRLRWEARLSRRQVAQSCHVSPSTVAEIEYRADAASLSWPLSVSDDAQLERLLYTPQSESGKAIPEWTVVHRELKKPGVTLQLLWHEYRKNHPEGLGYSQFCNRFRIWKKRLDVSMRIHHKAGEKTFIDFAGQTVDIIDSTTGEVRQAHVFVAALGASNYTFARATLELDKRAWLQLHIDAMDFFGGTTRVWVPDNLKAGVSKPNFYDPVINPAYRDLSEHYGAVVIPARVRRPQDKAKVENAVQQVERWVLAPLRDQRFFSLSELNEAIAERLQWLNTREFKQLEGSRLSHFEQLDRPALQPLPDTPFELCTWKLNAKVHVDHHVAFEHHFYSAPYTFIGEKVDIYATDTTVEILHKGRRIASHRRSFERGRYSTTPEHRPEAHRAYAEWSPERFIRWPNTEEVTRSILSAEKHPAQAYRRCLGLMRLEKRDGSARLEKACERAIAIQSPTYRSVKSILKHRLDEKIDADTEQKRLPFAPENTRGRDYYH